MLKITKATYTVVDDYWTVFSADFNFDGERMIRAEFAAEIKPTLFKNDIVPLTADSEADRAYLRALPTLNAEGKEVKSATNAAAAIAWMNQFILDVRNDNITEGPATLRDLTEAEEAQLAKLKA